MSGSRFAPATPPPRPAQPQGATQRPGAVEDILLRRSSGGDHRRQGPGGLRRCLYDPSAAEGATVSAVAASLGCGVLTAVADLHPGEIVLVGSGAGADALTPRAASLTVGARSGLSRGHSPAPHQRRLRHLELSHNSADTAARSWQIFTLSSLPVDVNLVHSWAGRNLIALSARLSNGQPSDDVKPVRCVSRPPGGHMQRPAIHTAGQRCGQPRLGSCGMPAPGCETAGPCHSHQPVVPPTA